MTFRIINPQDWTMVPPGKMLELQGEGERAIKLEINSEAWASLHLVEPLGFDATGEPEFRRTFLGSSVGMEKFEFNAKGNSSIDVTSDGEVWYFTNDGQYTAVEIPDALSFTKMVGRKERSDILEEIIRRQQLGLNRLHAQQQAEREEWQRQMGALADPATGEIDHENGDGLDVRSDAEESGGQGGSTVPAEGADKAG